MQNGEHLTMFHNYLKSTAVYKMGYRMVATFLGKKCYMNQIVKGVSCFCFQILFHTNNTLKILIRGDLSSTDTLLNTLKMEFKMSAL